MNRKRISPYQKIGLRTFFYLLPFGFLGGIYAAEDSMSSAVSLPIIENSKTASSLPQGVKELEPLSIVSHISAKAYGFEFPNGLRLVVVPDERNPVASMRFILAAGSDREHMGETGLAHFFEHNMFRKTKDQPEGNYDRVLSSVGGTGNAGTGNSFVTFYSSFPAAAFPTMLQLEAQRFLDLDVTDPYFSIEKGAVISERKLRLENDPMEKAQEAIRSLTERSTPLAWMTIGSKADVEAMGVQSAQTFYKDYYTPDNTILVIGGPFKINDVVNSVEKTFGSWSGKHRTDSWSYPDNYLSRDLGKNFICSENVRTQNYKIIYPSFSKSLQDVVYSLVLQALLDDNAEGTLERRLVKNKEAIEFDMAKVYWESVSNPFEVQVTLAADQSFDKVKSFWLNELSNTLPKAVVTDEIKQKVLKQCDVSDAEASEKITSLINLLTDNIFFFHEINVSEKVKEILSSMTTKDLQRWAADNVANDHFYVTGVVPTGMAEPCDEMAHSFAQQTKGDLK